MSDFIVDARDVHKRFGRNEVLKGVSLQVKPQEVVCIIGASGSGKTTFLRTLNQLETIDSGEIVAMMDEGETTLKAGDVLIQRGTNHAWSNRTNETTYIAFILIDAEPV